MKVYISHANGFDFENELYLPLERSIVLKQHELVLPHRPEYVDVNVSELFDTSDLVFAEVSAPSTGQGIELGRASERKIPIICAHKVGDHYSSSLRFITDSIESYRDTDQLVNILARKLDTFKNR